MKNQLSKDLGEPAPGRQSTKTGTTPISKQSRDSNARTVGKGDFENDRQSVPPDSNCCNGTRSNVSSQDLDSVKNTSNKEKPGNRGLVSLSMPLKLLPNFGEDPSRKVRKWNKAVERKFEMNMEAMSQDLKNKTSKINRGIRNMEEQLKDLDLERNLNTSSSFESQDEDDCQRSGVRFPSIHNGRRPSSRRQGSGHKCSYDPVRTKHKCHHFPCVRPTTYHTIGYRGNPDFTSWMSWEAIKESWNSPELVDNVSTSAHDVKVSPRMLTLRKEEKLRKEIERRKMENDMKRPQSWVTNYGQPMSYKQLKYPVRLSSLSN